MREMARSEIHGFMDEDYINEFPQDGCIFIETTIGELAERQTGTACGTHDNHAFAGLGADTNHNSRTVRALYSVEYNAVSDTHIQCDNERAANHIAKSVKTNGGSLRPEGKSNWYGFWIFESE